MRTTEMIRAIAGTLAGGTKPTGNHLSDWRAAFFGKRGGITDEVVKLNSYTTLKKTRLSDAWVNYTAESWSKGSGRFNQDRDYVLKVEKAFE